MNITIHHTGSAGNLIQVDDILIDPGVPIKEIKRCLNFRLSEIKGCLIGHAHLDHAKGAKDLIKAGVECFCSQETSDILGLSGHRLNILLPGVVWGIGKYKDEWRLPPFAILPFPVVHDAPGSLGFLIVKEEEKILYACDTNYIPYRFKGLTHILLGVDYDSDILQQNILNGTVDLSLGKRIMTNHMSLQTALKFFQANDLSRVQEIYILHLSDTNSDAEHFKREIEKVTGRPVII